MRISTSLEARVALPASVLVASAARVPIMYKRTMSAGKYTMRRRRRWLLGDGEFHDTLNRRTHGLSFRAGDLLWGELRIPVHTGPGVGGFQGTLGQSRGGKRALLAIHARGLTGGTLVSVLSCLFLQSRTSKGGETLIGNTVGNSSR